MNDHSEIAEIEKRMREAARDMRRMEPDVATAITVIDYDSDRRKNLLARYVKKHLNDGESVAAREIEARADPAYYEEYQSLFSQYELAQSTRKKYEGLETSWETARSLLARQRVTLNKFPEE